MDSIDSTEELVYEFDGLNREEIINNLLKLNYRRNSKQFETAIAMVGWLEKKLVRTGKMKSKTVLYSLPCWEEGYKAEMIVFSQCITIQNCAIANDLNISESSVKKAKEMLSNIGLISFLKTIKKDGKFIKLWVVDLKYYGNCEINLF